MAGCTSCGGNNCSGACDSKIKELAGIVGALGKDELKNLLVAADGDVNRYIIYSFIIRFI